jgi:hypothetical protein
VPVRHPARRCGRGVSSLAQNSLLRHVVQPYSAIMLAPSLTAQLSKHAYYETQNVSKLSAFPHTTMFDHHTCIPQLQTTKGGTSLRGPTAGAHRSHERLSRTRAEVQHSRAPSRQREGLPHTRIPAHHSQGQSCAGMPIHTLHLPLPHMCTELPRSRCTCRVLQIVNRCLPADQRPHAAHQVHCRYPGPSWRCKLPPAGLPM